jgi:alkanesulfonate monooxygenase SsuD/methylene tetrahydromethanopterin reductase-like flavin-dependent oxidoreductase (luciferase family)
MVAVSMRALKIGLLLPHWEGSLDGATPTWVDILAIAQQAEAVGFDSLWVVDHLFFRRDEMMEHFGLPVPPALAGLPPIGCWEGWSVLAAIAATTSRVELGTLVACAGYRNPAQLAKMADALDEISGGRLILGLGTGDSVFEHRTFGYPTDHRVSRFEEALAIVHPLLRSGRVDFSGAYYQAKECELRPRGPRPDGPPIVIAGTGPRMLRLTAQYADGWNGWLAYGRSQPDVLPPLRAKVDAACREVGRDPATLTRSVGARVAVLGRTVPGAEPLCGSVQEIVAGLRAFAEEGMTHLQVALAPSTLAGIEAFAPVLELLDSG